MKIRHNAIAELGKQLKAYAVKIDLKLDLAANFFLLQLFISFLIIVVNAYVRFLKTIQSSHIHTYLLK